VLWAGRPLEEAAEGNTAMHERRAITALLTLSADGTIWRMVHTAGSPGNSTDVGGQASWP
jgi:hypothetical protein